MGMQTVPYATKFFEASISHEIKFSCVWVEEGAEHMERIYTTCTEKLSICAVYIQVAGYENPEWNTTCSVFFFRFFA